MITKRQNEVLEYIKKYIKKKDYSPSLSEICKKFKLRSLGTAHKHVENLRKEGYLEKEKNKPRAIEIYKKNQ